MIKIITGWGMAGGSTVAHINLCNALNERGIECKLYSPHDWHHDKCSSGNFSELFPKKEDIIIVHFLNVPKLNCKKMLFSCHESNIWELSKKDLSNYSKIHYVSKWQQQYHNVKKSYFIAPNVLEHLINNKEVSGKVGGIIGSIDMNKQTHVSIKNALNDGCNIVYLFGNVTDQAYYENFVKPLIKDNVILFGYHNEKQKMYDMVTDVYHSAIRETWGYIKGECELTGTKYHSYGMCNFEYMSTDDIVNKWKEVF